MPSIYIHEKYIDWLMVSLACTQKQAKPGERTGAVQERLNMFLSVDVMNETQAISHEPPHGKQAAVQSKGQTRLGPPKHTVIHNNRQMQC